jgi:UDP-N-acetyl-2-amino-2-deoxyglucuronate dehydrogenase
MKQHRLLLVGHGGISKSYLEAFAKLERVEIAGVIGRSLPRAQAFAEQHGIAVYGTEMEDVAKRANATAVVICTPNAAHYEGVMEAARLGLHCLCEKPLHIAPEKQREMIAACRDRGVKLAVSYMRRFIKHLRYIKELIDAGKLGRITVVDVTIKHYRAKEYYDSWHGTVEMDGGGPFIQQGSHIIDLALWLSGGYRRVMDAKRFQVYHDIEVEDHGYALMEYGNGAIGMIEASTASFGMKTEGIEISGTHGSIAANYQGLTLFDVPGLTPPAFNPEESANPALFEQLAADFIASIEENREPFVSGEAAAAATELIMDIYSTAGQPIRTF